MSTNHPYSGATEAPKRVLVVDDDPQSRMALERALMSFGYDVEVASDGVEGLAKLGLSIDLIILDASMPAMDGYEVTRRIRADDDFRDLPIVMVTGLDSRQDRLRAVEAGVNDFLGKPFDTTELKLRAGWLLRMKDATDRLKRHREDLERRVAERTAALRQALEETAAAERRTFAAHLDTIRRLVLAAEHKDRETAAHIERIGRYCELIATRLALAPSESELLRHAAPMHDVGKIGIPDAILLKPGKLTEEEWEVMKRHTEIGAEILHGSPSSLLQAGETIALAHHERWDGSGYPNRLAGDAIPLSARICAVADVFDALTSSRSYRDALPRETAYEMMDAQRSRHFDPAVLNVFLAHRGEIEAIQAAAHPSARPLNE